jgi:peptide/nickel transport system permease protein
VDVAAPPAEVVLTEPPKTAATLSQWQLIRRLFARHRLAVISLNLLILLYGVAALAEFIAPYPAMAKDLAHPYCPPQLVRFSLSHGFYTYAMQLQVDPVTFRKAYVERTDQLIDLDLLASGQPYHLWGILPMRRHLIGVNDSQATFHFLGADKYGHDIFSRMIYGSRVSLSVGLIGIAITFLLGMTIGGISGYVGGRTDLLIQRGIEVINSFPHLPLWIAIGAVLPQDWSPLRIYFAITLALAFLGWTGLARVVRGKILSLREEDYATAARLMGAGHFRILFGHLLPGFASHIIVALSLSVPAMILGETSLSFLGLGLRPPIVSWGVMLQDCMDMQVVRYYPWLMLPVMAIVATVLAFNFIGDGLRDAADPYGGR